LLDIYPPPFFKTACITRCYEAVSNELSHALGSVFGTPLRSLKALFPSTQCSECSGCETECMTIDKFYLPLSLEPDKQEDTKLSEAKKFIVRNNEASAPRDEGEFRKCCDGMLGELRQPQRDVNESSLSRLTCERAFTYLGRWSPGIPA
jgi:hypothetical protein